MRYGHQLTAFAFTFSALISSHLRAEPVVIAHRGASGYLPEHTLPSAVLAHAQGADFIEQDLVLTKDDQLLVLHDIHLERVTDVESRFPARQREDGRYYAIDFTLAELKQLKVHERAKADGTPVFANRYQGNGDFRLSTFSEQVEAIRNLNRQLGKRVGFYPEIKSPAWHREQGKDISKVLVKALESLGLNSADENIYVQCFDFAETKRLRRELGLNTKLVQLIGENSWEESTTDYTYLQSLHGLQEVASIADGIGPWLPQLITVRENGVEISGLTKRAKASGLVIHPYTHRNDQLHFGMTNQQLLALLFDQLKIDGVFSDFPGTVKAYLQENRKN